MAKTKSSTKIKIGAALATGIIGAALIFGIGKNVADLNLGRDVSDIMLGNNQTTVTAFASEEEIAADASIVSYVQEYQATRDAVYGSNDLEEETTAEEDQAGEEQDAEQSGQEQDGEEQDGENNPFGSFKDETEAGNKSDNTNQIEPEPEEETTGGLVNDSVLDQDNVSDSYNEKNPSNIETGKGTNETIKATFSDSQRTGVAPNVWIVAGAAAAAVIGLGIGLGVGLGTRGKKLSKVETKLNADSSNYSSVVEFQNEIEKLYTTGNQKLISKIKKTYAKCQKAALNDLQEANLKEEYAERAKHNKTVAKNNIVGAIYDKDSYKQHNESVKTIAQAEELGEKIEGKSKKSPLYASRTKKINEYNASANEKMTNIPLGDMDREIYFNGVPTFKINAGDQPVETFPINIKRAIAHSASIDGANLSDVLSRVQELFPVVGKQTNICKITLTTNAGETLDLQCSFDAGIGYEVCKSALFVEVKNVIEKRNDIVAVTVAETQQTHKQIEKSPKKSFNVDIDNKNNNIPALIKRIDAANEVMNKFNSTYNMVNEQVFNDSKNTKNETKPADDLTF